MQSKSVVQYLDSLRALATIGVILIHISSPLVNMTWSKNMPYWWVGNVADSLVRFAVPVFLMLSGATMLGKEYSLTDFYKKRFLRVFLPFVFWLLMYWIYRWAMLKPASRPVDVGGIADWAMNLFLKEGVSKHLWYIYMILFIYMILPFLGILIRKLSNNALLVLLLGWVILTFAFRSTPMNLYSWTGDYGSKFLGWFLHLGYVVLGFYLSRLTWEKSGLKPMAGIVFILTVLVSAVGTYLISTSHKHLDLSFYSYLNLNTIIQSTALFVWLKNTEISSKFVLKLQNTISNYSYGIYLVHIMVIGILFRNGIYWSFAHPLVSLPVLVAGVTTVSFGIVFLLRKIPGGKYVAG